MGALARRVIGRIAGLMVAAAGCLGWAESASGVIVSGLTPMTNPDNGYVGLFCGSTCVAVGTNWFVTAKHVGGSTNNAILMRGVWYTVVEIRQHPYLDVQILRTAQAVPGFHKLATGAGLGDPVLLGGVGVTAAAALPGNAGYDWAGPRQETWGANTIEGDGPLLAVQFDPPSSAAAVPYESVFGINDSGGGLFTIAADGSLTLAGIAVSVTGFGEARWQTIAFALNVEQFRTWIQPQVDPSVPLSSGIAAPRSMVSLPGLPVWAGGLLMAGTLAGVRRRRA